MTRVRLLDHDDTGEENRINIEGDAVRTGVKKGPERGK